MRWKLLVWCSKFDICLPHNNYFCGILVDAFKKLAPVHTLIKNELRDFKLMQVTRRELLMICKLKFRIFNSLKSYFWNQLVNYVKIHIFTTGFYFYHNTLKIYFEILNWAKISRQENGKARSFRPGRNLTKTCQCRHHW